jgi:glutathione peroxidase
MNFYDLEVAKPDGSVFKMNVLKGKTVLIVNTATQCGLTPQFEGLEKLHQDYKEEGLVVIGFPCNQFMGQEPLTNEKMEEVCKVNHGVTFQLTEKIDVNGKDSHPIFKYLKKELGGGLFGKKIKWNFTKFLINREGIPIKRYSPTTKPDSISKYIDKVLK